MGSDGELLENAHAALGAAIGQRDHRVAQGLHVHMLAGEGSGDR